MARKKIDGVIEAVRYTPDGKISVVRTYIRHGVVWSDRIILGRMDLADKLSRGQRFVIGGRKHYLGSEFDTGAPVRLVGGHILTDGQPAVRDLLAGIAVF